MDGLNVNLAFLDILNEARSDANVGKILLDLGTCGLHIMHNVFKHGENAGTWDNKNLLSIMFKIFHESPSRQADYEMLTSSSLTDYPLKSLTSGNHFPNGNSLLETKFVKTKL